MIRFQDESWGSDWSLNFNFINWVEQPRTGVAKNTICQESKMLRVVRQPVN